MLEAWHEKFSSFLCVYVFFTVVMVLRKSNIGPYKSLKGLYLALVQVPGNHGPVKQNVYHHLSGTCRCWHRRGLKRATASLCS